MSRRNIKARDKLTLKNTRNGLLEHNKVTGEDLRLSKREAELNLRSQAHECETFSGAGKWSEAQPPPKTQNARKRFQQDKPDSATERNTGALQEAAKRPAYQITEQQQPDYAKPNSSLIAETPRPAQAVDSPDTPIPDTAAYRPDLKISTESSISLNIAPDEAASAEQEKRKQAKPLTESTEKSKAEEVKAGAHQESLSGKAYVSATEPNKPDKPDRLKFTPEETAPDATKIYPSRELSKAKRQADRSARKLETAKDNLPRKRKLRAGLVYNEKTGKAKRKLYFESEVKSQAEHLKGPLPLRPVKAAGNSVFALGHRKIFQAERENVGTEAAHKVEILAEGGVRYALRLRKTAPYRKVERLERKAARKSKTLTYRQALSENPKLKSNILARALQKQKIKRDYAKAVREAQKSARKTKKAASTVSGAGRAIVGAVRRHPLAAVVVILISLLFFALMSLIGAFGSLGSGGLSGILTASYLAEDTDVDMAELIYSEWEADILEQIANTESTYSGYDEYRYSIAEISHNPYELMAYLTVKYQNFGYDAVIAYLREMFDEQYTLTFTPSVETRHNSVTTLDPDTGESYETQEAYDWYVLEIKLTARSFSDVTISRLSGGEYAHYALLMQTKGSRQYIGSPFGFDWLSCVTSYYGYRVHPISGEIDLHRGVDIGAAQGTEIRSGQDGTVTFAGWSGDYGYVTVIDDGKGLLSKYAHCETLFVTAGQEVKMGDVIAAVGSTGNSTGPHLHIEVMKNGVYLNPLFFMDTGSLSLTPVYGTPGAPMGDGTYAALIAEAEKYLGFPYVFGGSSPKESFDCSGYICWILTMSGTANTGRLSAQGLYNISTPVPPNEAKPGDLVFFHSTYSTPNTVTHVGIFVGGSPRRMIHCGDPIQYTSIDTAYWQSHFYAFGRIS